MKKPRLPFLLALLVLPLVAADDHGHDHADGGHDHHAAPEWAGLFGDASLPVVWQSLIAADQKIAAALQARSTTGVAAWAETIHLAAHALVDQVNLDDPAPQRRLDAALHQAAELADVVLDAAQHGEVDTAATAFRRLHAAITLAKVRLPKSLLEAESVTPRFAETPGHSHDDEHDH